MTSRPPWPDPDTDPSGELFDDAEPTMMADAMSAGAFFGDRFQIVGNLGSGAMGRVVQAIDLTTHGEVALKVLHRERAKDPEAIQRLAREAAILGAIGHPGIVRVVAMGRAPDGTPWLAMELLRGETLKARILRGPMGAMEVLPILNTLCDALAAAHHAGVVHRDLKAENVLLLASGQPPCKILDFGLSRFTASKTLTRTGTILGTPRSMAPEQIRSASSATHRVDVYAVGILLFEMLTGRSPYPAEDMGQLLGCVLEGRTIPLAQLRPDLPPGVGAVIARAMAMAPEQRWETAGQIAEAYANALGVRSGRSNLVHTHVPVAGGEGAQPLLDPFAASAPIGGGPVGDLASDPMLQTVPPGVVLAGPRAAPGPTGALAPAFGAPPVASALGAPSAAAAPGAPAVPPPRGAPAAVAPAPSFSQPVAMPQAAQGSRAEPGQRASWPGAAPDFTRPRGSSPGAVPAPPAPARAAPRAKAPARSPALGCAIFVVALAIVVVVAAALGVALRAWTDGRVSLPRIGGSP